MKPRVYLAGPDVFNRDFQSIFDQRASYCDAKGLEALIPVDNRLKDASAIYENNIRLLKSADAIVANISPFRGPHSDVGTAFEIGYGKALGLPIWAFSIDRDRLAGRIKSPLDDGRDESGMAIEPFNLRENLMIECALYDRVVHASFECAVDMAASVITIGVKGSERSLGSRVRMTRR